MNKRKREQNERLKRNQARRDRELRDGLAALQELCAQLPKAAAALMHLRNLP